MNLFRMCRRMQQRKARNLYWGKLRQEGLKLKYDPKTKSMKEVKIQQPYVKTKVRVKV